MIVEKKSINGSVDEKTDDSTLNHRIGMKNEFFTRHLPIVERSDGTRESFVPNKILESLISETKISHDDAKKVTEKIVVKLLKLNQKIVTAQFIREQACGILYEINPVLRFEYTRLGMPFNDFKHLCGTMLDGYDDKSVSDPEVVEKIVSNIGKDKINEILSCIFRDYIGVKKSI